jgi:uncharacterized protein YdeI (YjbR/CyaY-like superfamily)
VGAGAADPATEAIVVTGVPPTSSDHPERWRFDYPIYHPVDRAAWRAWLAANGEQGAGVWVATWRSVTGRPTVAYVDVVLEALCFGWIDSTVNVFDDERGLQLVTPRRPKSTWTRLNRQRVAELDAAGLMTEAGWRSVEVAKANGWWTILDPVEDLIEPPELGDALDASPTARVAWDGFPPSARKQMLTWLVLAAKPETVAKRVAKIVAEAEQGRRAQG